MTHRRAKMAHVQPQRFSCADTPDSTLVKDGGEILADFATRAGAEAVARILNAVADLPFDEIGRNRDGSSDFAAGRERVAYFIMQALGYAFTRQRLQTGPES